MDFLQILLINEKHKSNFMLQTFLYWHWGGFEIASASTLNASKNLSKSKLDFRDLKELLKIFLCLYFLKLDLIRDKNVSKKQCTNFPNYEYCIPKLVLSICQK